jgi:serine phosphatase RsbU (regulator of sigma subunit)
VKSHGLPIGILPGTRYATQTRAFPAGSCVVLYSDGITEAEDLRGEEFGNERLEALLERAHRLQRRADPRSDRRRGGFLRRRSAAEG